MSASAAARLQRWGRPLAGALVGAVVLLAVGQLYARLGGT
jgi:hypothetical protein